jgi:hypothetical protein
MDRSANGDFQIYLDAQKVLAANFTPQWNSDGTPVTGPGPSAPETTTPDGGSISYTSDITATAVNVTVNLKTVSGMPHTFGVVQLNGACMPDEYGRRSCLGDPSNTNGQPGINNGYVLAEGQTSFTLNAGANNSPINLTLQGVIESAYLCDAACDGQAGQPDQNGVYHITAYPTDENGNAVTGTLPYANGKWDIVELDNQNRVTIKPDNPGPYSAPNPTQLASGNWWDAQKFTFTCNSTGDTAIAARLLQSNPSKGLVTGFSYTVQNYPQPGDVISSVGAATYFGNTLALHCEAYGSVGINVH